MSVLKQVNLPPRVSWSEFMDTFQWEQGQHVTLLGHTGSGKTTLARHIITKRTHRLMFATKPRDPSIKVFVEEDKYKLTRTWPIDSRIHKRVVFWPKIENATDIVAQAESIGRCLQSVYRTGGWCLYFDEVRYISDTLGLKGALELLWLQGRALKLSVLAGTQRPAWIPREAYSEADHLFLWRSTNRYDLKRLEDASNVDTKKLSPILANLPKHDVLHINTRDGEYTRTRVSP